MVNYTAVLLTNTRRAGAARAARGAVVRVRGHGDGRRRRTDNDLHDAGMATAKDPERTVIPSPSASPLGRTGTCRSALAERLGHADLDEVLGDEAGAIRLASAGTRAVVGSGMHPDGALVLRGLGAEPAASAPGSWPRAPWPKAT
jgi:hypothetical protein